MAKSLNVLESLLPEFFIGANDLIGEDSAVKMRHGTLTINKQPANSTSRTFLMNETSLKYEYELYHYALAKLNRLYDQINSENL